MVYVKLSQNQLNTLKSLPNNLNSSTTSHNIGGVLILNKAQEIKQIILDFQAYQMDELYTNHKDKRVHLSDHIKQADPKYNYTFTFEIENVLKKQQNKVEFSCFSIPDIFQWIKCVIHSIYRNVYNHIVFSGSGKLYIISMKKTYFSNLFRKKTVDKLKIKDMYHILMKDYVKIYNNHKEKYLSLLNIPEELHNYFDIKDYEKKTDDIFIDYKSHNPNLIRASI